MEDYNKLSETISTAIKEVEDGIKDLTLYEWLSEKKQDMLRRGYIHRYHIFDTASYEWNALRDREATYISAQECGLTDEFLSKLGIKYVIHALGIYWMIRFNA